MTDHSMYILHILVSCRILSSLSFSLNYCRVDYLFSLKKSLLDGNVDCYSRNYCRERPLLKGRSTVQRRRTIDVG